MKDFRKQLKKTLKEHKPSSYHVAILFLPLLLGMIYILAREVNTSLKKQIEQNRIEQFVSPGAIAPLPLVKVPYNPIISADAAIIIDDASKVVIYEKNAHFRFSMASTTKIMTALIGLEYYKNNDMLMVKRDMVEGTTVGMKKGDIFYFDDLLYGMLLPSGNDAAFVIADNYPGGIPQFVKRMNELALSLHLYDTHFSDPAGLDDTGNYTTSYNLALLSSYALKNKSLARIFATKKKVIANVDGTNEYEIYNLNKLLGFEGVTGIKTGFTQGAGGVLATSKVENGHTFIIIVMKSDDRFFDTENLLRIVSNNVSFFYPGTGK